MRSAHNFCTDKASYFYLSNHGCSKILITVVSISTYNLHPMILKRIHVCMNNVSLKTIRIFFILSCQLLLYMYLFQAIFSQLLTFCFPKITGHQQIQRPSDKAQVHHKILCSLLPTMWWEQMASLANPLHFGNTKGIVDALK